MYFHIRGLNVQCTHTVMENINHAVVTVDNKHTWIKWKKKTNQSKVDVKALIVVISN